MDRQLIRIAFMCALAYAISACSLFREKCEPPEPEVITEIEVKEKFIPVPHKKEIPKNLKGSFKPETKPSFVKPANSDARAALTKEGIDNFQAMLFQMHKRIRAWEEFEGVEKDNEEVKEDDK